MMVLISIFLFTCVCLTPSHGFIFQLTLSAASEGQLPPSLCPQPANENDKCKLILCKQSQRCALQVHV